MTDRVRIGINGFGRMGRLALRAGWDRDDLEFVHVNEVKGGAADGAHLLEFDSVHGRWPRPVADLTGCVDGRRSAGPTPLSPALAWGDLGVDVVLECSGRFRSGRSRRTSRAASERSWSLRPSRTAAR